MNTRDIEKASRERRYVKRFMRKQARKRGVTFHQSLLQDEWWMAGKMRSIDLKWNHVTKRWVP